MCFALLRLYAALLTVWRTHARTAGIDAFALDDAALHPLISECRVFKSEAHLRGLQIANRKR
jgi:hypothetical protein